MDEKSHRHESSRAFHAKEYNNVLGQWDMPLDLLFTLSFLQVLMDRTVSQRSAETQAKILHQLQLLHVRCYNKL